MANDYPTLNAKQADFSATLVQLLAWATRQGIRYSIREVQRTREQARIYKDRGVGILNSNHVHCLAADIYVLDGNVVKFELDTYAALGAQWKTLHPLARWGGDFSRRDDYHFSFEHRGTM